MQERHQRLGGRTVLISGASGGLGERFARICAAQGANVVLGARRIERLEALAGEIRATGAGACAVSLDVQDEASVIAAFDRAEQEFGPVDSVIANAGIERSGSATKVSVEDFDQVFAVNVRGVFLTAREAARRMRAADISKRGRILLISSITARIAVPGLMPYSVSKAAVSHMARMLAREWAAHGPNVNALSPGYIETDLNSDWFASDLGQRQLAGFPRERLADIRALDEPAIFLLSDEAEFTTGSDFVIDDGQTL